MAPGGVLPGGVVREFYVLAHADDGPLQTFFTRAEAIAVMLDLVHGDPELKEELYVDRFSLVVADSSER